MIRSIQRKISIHSMATFETLNFDNKALQKLPIEESGDYLIQRPIRNACFSRVKPTPIESPKIVCYSSALNLTGLDLKELERDDAADFLCGNIAFPNAEYAAHCYCGHQLRFQNTPRDCIIVILNLIIVFSLFRVIIDFIIFSHE